MSVPWLPDLSLQDLHRLGSYLSGRQVDIEGETALGIVIFSAPWMPRISTEVVQERLISLAPTGLEDVITFAANVRLVEDELALYIGDDGVDTVFPLPPSTLPSLAVISLAAEESIPTVTFVRLDQVAIQDALLNQDKSPFLSLRREVESIVRNIESDLDLRVSASACASALRIFIAGDRSSVGKSSVCLGILGNLMERQGFAAEDLAYIKPATQSESTQLVQVYCDEHDIECVPIGPLVYYRGFTRAFLAGETPSSDELLATCAHAVDRIARGKRVVLVDGVGFPAVGSICGTDNASVLKACGYPTAGVNENSTSDDWHVDERRPMGVVLVGGSGVGAAVDAFNLNATYFESKQVPVLGAIFNKLSLTGFYSLENCREQVSRYFDMQRQSSNVNYQPFGFVPMLANTGSAARPIDLAHDFVRTFGDHVDVAAIVAAASDVKRRYEVLPAVPSSAATSTIPTSTRVKTDRSLPSRRIRARQDIELAAVQSGAQKSA